MPSDDPKNKIAPQQQNITSVKQIRIGSQKSAIQQRIEAAALLREEQALQQQEAAAEGSRIAGMMPNRIAILPDCSGSMAGERIRCEKLAVDEFLKNTDFSNTSIAFNAVGDDNLKSPLLADINSCTIAAQQIGATGGTPICEQLRFALDNIPMTRAVLISDGEPTDGDPVGKPPVADNYQQRGPNDGVAYDYREAGIPIDTIFIGSSGKKIMQQIAEITGGIFIEFAGADLKQLAASLKYLTPKHRALLVGMSETDAKQLLGASQVPFADPAKQKGE